MDVDISKWHPIGWKQDFFGRPLQESITGEIVTIDELMARYNFLLGAAQQRRAAELPSSAEVGFQADDSQNSKSAIG